jgi:hypothetical protein
MWIARRYPVTQDRYRVTTTPHHTHRNTVTWTIPQWNGQREKCVSQPGHGWALNKRNKLLHFKDEDGSILWHNTNRVELFLKRESNSAIVKRLFCKAFDSFIPDWKEIDSILNEGEFTGRHHTFKIGDILPSFSIPYFARSHGLTIYSDGSHPDAIEVNETKPFWLNEMRQIGEDFKQNMASHMSLLNEMAKMQRELSNSAFSARLLRVLRKGLAHQHILLGIVAKIRSKMGKPRKCENDELGETGPRIASLSQPGNRRSADKTAAPTPSGLCRPGPAPESLKDRG